MLKIGLTGGIGSGKSMVARWLAQWGATVIDTDDVSHELTSTAGQAIPHIKQAFGPTVVDAHGALDRAQMRALVFQDPGARKQLEAILHPLIREHTLAQAQAAQGRYVVIVIPLLVESGRWVDYFDEICVVDCDEPTQIQRVQRRSGLTVEQVQQIMRAQATRKERLQVADQVIDNGGQTDLQTLEEQVQQLHRHWCARSQQQTRQASV